MFLIWLIATNAKFLVMMATPAPKISVGKKPIIPASMKTLTESMQDAMAAQRFAKAAFVL
ncbi:hypothetical protein COU37_00735 [Candidatus Micrarchaeota archaeon CG10_big_fil_rev_8_21_14_0_10_45_29]|nr:MAG: hypothetical protein COU37_00735 [Candidatus Micrarchaeota archaeon CG10_big_fil_rev_8_21_14_0_10_45_29]